MCDHLPTSGNNYLPILILPNKIKQDLHPLVETQHIPEKLVALPPSDRVSKQSSTWLGGNMSVTLMITLMATISTQHLSWRSPQQSNYQFLDANVQQEKNACGRKPNTPMDIFAVESLAPYRLEMLN